MVEQCGLFDELVLAGERELWNTLLCGDAFALLKLLPDNSVDALITDPPAAISFMNKAFDSSRGGRTHWVAWLAAILRECLRVVKPGGHACVWAFPRTSHWTMAAIEDSGWEIRDKLYHCFGSGFPKSLNVGKALDELVEVERPLAGISPNTRPAHRKGGRAFDRTLGGEPTVLYETQPVTEAANYWDGWGTGLKPAVEEWVLARKPLSEKSVAQNVLTWGTGALNIDAVRLELRNGDVTGKKLPPAKGWKNRSEYTGSVTDDWKKGRWPAQLLLSHTAECAGGVCMRGCPVHLLDEQSIGVSRYFAQFQELAVPLFYAAKASRSERDAGCEDLPVYTAAELVERTASSAGMNSPRAGAGRTSGGANTHPTVKNLKLMRYLCRLITPPGGTVLDCFAGSGSTLVAAIQEGFSGIGIELEEEYARIASARLAHALKERTDGD